MRILVDADACPVKEIIEKIAKEFNVEVILFIDTAHNLNSNYSKIIVVDKGIDSVDLKIVSSLNEFDIVVTGDYGLASLVLLKGARAINQFGMIYTNDNIEKLLFERFIGAKNRKSNYKTKNIKKRTKVDDLDFEKLFYNLIKENI